MEPTVTMPFTPEMEAAYAKARARLDAGRLKQLLFDITDIHSPTGATRAAVDFVAARMKDIGLKPTIDTMTEISANVLGEKRGSGGGATLLLYAPIDTHLEGDESDYPWAGPEQFADLQPRAKMVDDWVYGLGSSNPKAMVAGLMEVATALIEADLPLKGTLNVGFADGGMPVTIPQRGNAGMSHGVFHLLNRGMAPDFAIIMKPWNWVYHEEPGMAWFKIGVKGTLGYAGVPRGLDAFRSSVVPAATMILELEKWLVDYAERNKSGDIYPHGWIAGVRGGWIERPAFPSAVTEIFFDVRVSPRTTPGDVKSQFEAFMSDFKAHHPDIDCDWDMYGSTPGGTTDPANWIIQSGRRGWERIEGRPYPKPEPLGGQTDGAALRRLGVPTARMGWPWPAEGSPEPIAEGLGGMGATYVPDLMPCLEKILYACIDTLMRPRAEMGL
ncbi:MAG: acetylornithine deacetylase [Sphingobium sp.]|jgi:acetylornithine deacetylase/succinyl-diaminopimelate desuccinylase-like protein|nr:acetylornithine deacetylase [Sphingobium sp.]MCI1271168.1 acetylornithine deacetylase [Sphingobium sp.]MCI1754794.1 acetylornithine deacetylase [Sphingobium sp.]MCI2053032.1 acetylornithine deacetylase [Sphingobium sp.]